MPAPASFNPLCIFFIVYFFRAEKVTKTRKRKGTLRLVPFLLTPSPRTLFTVADLRVIFCGDWLHGLRLILRYYTLRTITCCCLITKTKQSTNSYKHTKAFGKGDYKGGKPTARFSPFVLFCFPFFAKKEKEYRVQQNFVLYKHVLLTPKQGILRCRDSYNNAVARSQNDGAVH